MGAILQSLSKTIHLLLQDLWHNLTAFEVKHYYFVEFYTKPLQKYNSNNFVNSYKFQFLPNNDTWFVIFDEITV